MEATDEGREYKSELLVEEELVMNKLANGAGLKTEETKSSNDVFSL